jgi:hypothetical protein
MRRGLAGAVMAALVWLGAATAWAQSAADRSGGSDTKSVSDPDSDAGPDADPDADSASTTTVSVPGSESAPDAESAPGSDTDSGPVPAPDAVPAPVDPLAHREREIEEAISRVSLQQREHSTLLPWLLLGSGIAAVAVSGGYGVGHVLLCESSCGIEFWPPWILMGGLAMITGGTVWLQSARADREAIDSRRYHLEQQLQRLRWEQGRAERSPRGAIAGLRF